MDSTLKCTTHVHTVDAVSPERWLDSRQMLQRLAQALDALPDRCREVVWLRRVGELPQKAAAARLGISGRTVEKHLAKGMRLLADHLPGAGARDESQGILTRMMPMHDSRRIEHTAAEWLARRDANGLAEEDQRTLESWLAASPRHRVDRHARRINLLQGEGYFDVAHDAARPFAVSADARRVVALGTRFAVRRGSHALRVAVTNLFDKVPPRDPTHTAYPY